MVEPGSNTAGGDGPDFKVNVQSPPPTVEARALPEDVSEGEGVVSTFLRGMLWVISSILMFIPIFWLTHVKTFAQYERAVQFRLGKLKRPARGPGLVAFLPCIDEWQTVDLRTVSEDVAPQELITKDNVTLNVNAVIFFRVRDPVRAVCAIDNWRLATSGLAQTTLRSVIGSVTLQELLQHRDDINDTLCRILDEATDPWGIRVVLVEIKDIVLPAGLQRALSAEAEASREAKAKIVAADGELQASRKLLEASSVLMESPSSIKLRYLQTLTQIAAERNRTILCLDTADLGGNMTFAEGN
eukprot:GABV01001164.1.p1 GENE.GABV01001164.1~~GABV01001164.1.p1  ORF type:complete len:300 (-),score=129.11 GABV01001164.1:15-914(-)